MHVNIPPMRILRTLDNDRVIQRHLAKHHPELAAQFSSIIHRHFLLKTTHPLNLGVWITLP